MYDEPQPLQPAYTGATIPSSNLIAKLDGEDGFMTMWPISGGSVGEVATYAQRVDAQGNICWGDSALKIFNVHSSGDFCSDGFGGWFFVISDETSPGVGGYKLQHINEDGQLAWPDTGLVIYECSEGINSQHVITKDGAGGFYMVWRDDREPYSLQGALYRQRYDNQGDAVWQPGGIFIYEDPFFYEVFSDEQGGFLFHGDPQGSYLNHVFRFDSDGDLIWDLENISENYHGGMVVGEPNFYYIGWISWDDMAVYGQRIDIDGNVYWPEDGLLIYEAEAGWDLNLWPAFSFRYPYFYALYETRHVGALFPSWLYMQSFNLDGNPRYGDDGTLMTVVPPQLYTWARNSVVPDMGHGAVAVWYLEPHHDIYAKRVDRYGQLGGDLWPPNQVPNPGPPFELGISDTNIKFNMNVPGDVSIAIYNLLGRVLSNRNYKSLSRGIHNFSLEIQNLPSGIFFVRVETPTGTQMMKFPIIR